MEERLNSMELRLSCTNPWKWFHSFCSYINEADWVPSRGSRLWACDSLGRKLDTEYGNERFEMYSPRKNMPRIRSAASCRDHSVYAPSHCERALLCNAISHWLGAYTDAGPILCMNPANERWRHIVRPSLIGWTHTQNGCWSWPCLLHE